MQNLTLDYTKVEYAIAKGEQLLKESNFPSFRGNIEGRDLMLGNVDVAVTDGDRVESEIHFGWNVNYYGIGDLVDIINEITDAEIEVKLNEYNSLYRANIKEKTKMVKMRLRRAGAKKQPFYRVIVADERSPRGGRFIDEIGYYNPLTEEPTIKIDADKAKAWIANGAQPTDTVKNILVNTGVIPKPTKLSPAKTKVRKSK